MMIKDSLKIDLYNEKKELVKLSMTLEFDGMISPQQIEKVRSRIEQSLFPTTTTVGEDIESNDEPMPEWRQRLEKLDESDCDLNEWEVDFVESCIAQSAYKQSLSEKQIDRINAIHKEKILGIKEDRNARRS